MDSGYWTVEIEHSGEVSFECVYAASADEVRQRLGGMRFLGDPGPVTMSWFHLEPLRTEMRDVGGRQVASLRSQFFGGGLIGCETDGITFVFTPDLLSEPKGETRGGEDMIIYGNAIMEADGHPELRQEIELEGLDDEHLVDRLSVEIVRAVGAARKAACLPVAMR